MYGCSGEQSTILAVDRLISIPDTVPLKRPAYYSLKDFGRPDWKELYAESGLAETYPERVISGDSIGFLMLSSDEPLAAWTCTGFMLTDTLFLTNWHCGAPEEDPRRAPEGKFWTEDVIQNAILDLSWDSGSVSREFQVLRVEQPNRELDFAVLRVKPLGKQAPIATSALANWAPETGDHVYIIHHPLAMKKQYSAACRVGVGTPHLFANWVDSTRATDFTHDCDTEGGSSGAPVFAKTGEIIGLHHLAYEFDPASCKVVSENKAVSMSEILKVLDPELRQALTIHTH